MQFEHSIYLGIGLLACLTLGGFYRRLQKSHRELLKTFAAPQLVERLTASVSPRRRTAKVALLSVAIACGFVALSRPQAGFRWEEAHRQGIDILMAVDTSKSMLANDVQPDRLTRAKLGIQDFVDRLDGDRVGLIPFSGTAFLMCPLTLDYDAFRQSLAALDTTLMPRGGTDLAAAIGEAEAAFDKESNHRILVLITDGEDLEGEALAAAKAASKRGITIHTVGVGTSSGELIPLAGAGFLKDEQGQVVKSRLDEDMLRQIAEETGGAYAPLGRQAEGLDAIYQQKLSLIPEEDFAQRMHKVPLERFQWPLLVMILLLAVDFGMTDRKRTRRTARNVVLTAGRRWVRKRGLAAAVPVGLLLAAGAPDPVQASPGSAEKAYAEGDFAAASEQYQDALMRSPEDPVLTFNRGAAAYKTSDYAGAAGAFQAILGDENLELQGQAYYNLGNTLYRQGEQTEDTHPQQTVQQWQQALTAYEGTLALNAGDEDAQFNYNLVKRRLEELQKQQEQEQPCENPKDSQAKDDEGDPEDSQDGGSGENNAESPPVGPSDESEGQHPQEERSGDQDSDEPDGAEPDTGEGDQESDGTEGEDQEQPASPDGDDEEQSAPADASAELSSPDRPGQDESSSEIGNRRRPGQMTPEEAADLLDSLKGEDVEAPFVPMSNGAGGSQKIESWRDW